MYSRSTTTVGVTSVNSSPVSDKPAQSSADEKGVNRIHILSLDKPKQGDPCNGCGMCCLVQVCALGVELGDSQACKALLHGSDGSYACGLVRNPYRYVAPDIVEAFQKIDSFYPGENRGEQMLKDMYAKELGAGRGCDSVDFEELDEEDQDFVRFLQTTPVC